MIWLTTTHMYDIYCSGISKRLATTICSTIQRSAADWDCWICLIPIIHIVSGVAETNNDQDSEFSNRKWWGVGEIDHLVQKTQGNKSTA